MYRRFIPVAAIALLLSGSAAFAQCGCNAPSTYVRRRRATPAITPPR